MAQGADFDDSIWINLGARLDTFRVVKMGHMQIVSLQLLCSGL